jgi:hypothetical protein
MSESLDITKQHEPKKRFQFLITMLLLLILVTGVTIGVLTQHYRIIGSIPADLCEDAKIAADENESVCLVQSRHRSSHRRQEIRQPAKLR